VYFNLTYDTNDLRPTLQKIAVDSGFQVKIDGEIDVMVFPYLGLGMNLIEWKFSEGSYISAERLSLIANWRVLLSFLKSSILTQSNQWITDPASIDVIDNVHLVNAKVHTQSKPWSKLSLSDIQLKVDNISGRGKTFPVELKITMLEKLKLNITTSLGLDIPSQILKIPNFEIESQLGSIEGQTLIEGASGAITGNLEISNMNLLGLTEILKFHFPQFSIPKMRGERSLRNIGATAEFDFIASETAHLNGALRIDGQPLRFNLVSDALNQNLKILLSAKSFNLSNYFPKVEEIKQQITEVQYSILLSPLAPLIMWPGATQIEIDLEQLRMDEFKISNVYANFSSFGSTIKLNTLNADLFGGYADLTGLVNLQKNIPRSEFKINLNTINLASMLPAITGNSDTTGSLSMDLDIAFNGIDLENVLNSAVGNGEISVMQPRYSEINLEQTLCSAVTLLEGSRSSKNWPTGTLLQDLSAELEVQSGSLMVRELISGTENIDLNLHGAVDIRSKDYQFLLKARLNDRSKAQDSCFNKLSMNIQDIPFTCTGNVSAINPPMCFPNMDVLGGMIKNKMLSDLLRKLSDL
tara:strand:+ start:132 stop:1877 length:1746 start_codon:yes stop_codon:yes gene_type:complete